MGALDNLRVIDFGHYVAGPMTGMLLADQGAEVIKVDRPGATDAASVDGLLNRGKRRIELDLTNDDDLEAAKRLVARADVLIENFRPGVMSNLGLGEGDVRADNPGLIYVSIPAFGPEDDRAATPGWDGTVLAALDGHRPPVAYRELVQQLHRRPDDRTGDPVAAVEPMPSMFAAIVAAAATSSALCTRDRTGLGQRVEVPLFDAMVQAIGLQAMTRLPFKPSFSSAVTPWNHQYRCADDRWVHVVCERDDQSESLAELIERPDLFERSRGDGDAEATYELIIALNGIFATRPASEWETLLADDDLPISICRTRAEWLEHPHATDGSLLVSVDAVDGPISQPAPIVELGGEESEQVDLGPIAAPNQHRAEILAELTDEPPEPGLPTSLNPGEPPLAGLRVLDIGSGVAAPLCGRVLAELGADVIAVDDPNERGVTFHHELNRGKRSMLLDIDSDDGHAIFRDLLAEADVLIESLQPGEAEQLGIGYDALAGERPDLIYVSLSAYDELGPWSDLEGTGETVQALTGLQTGYGGDDEPAVWPFPMIVDHAAGYAAAFGVATAAAERQRTGRGRRVATSLTRVASMLQATGHGYNGGDDDGLFGLFQCQDGWLHVGIADRADLNELLALTADKPDDGDTRTSLAAWCAQQTVDDAVELLIKEGAGAHRLTWLQDAMTDPVVARRGLGVVVDHPTIGMIRTTGPGPWFSRARLTAGQIAPNPGANAGAILAEIGRADQLEELAANGVIALP